MIAFVGAGPGAVDLITLRGAKLLAAADVLVYAGSLVNPELVDTAKADCERHNSAGMTLEQVLEVLIQGHEAGKQVVRLHTGDPSLYGAIREQMDALKGRGIPFTVVPGVSSFSAAAAALQVEYTLPGVSQTVILTRAQGRTPVPRREDIAGLAAHGASMAVFLSAGLLDKLTGELLEGGYAPHCPAALVYKASWKEEKVVRTTVSRMREDAEAAGIHRTALILVGEFLGDDYHRSLLYHPEFTHGYRKGESR